ncbi:MAG: hypothetical protein HQM16_03010 [Deltaproteobacteria bacterium]|nr:hypothetical protein [Deltaproteobacteria bacterium]
MAETDNALDKEKVNQSILEHIVLGVAHEINNPNAFVRLNLMNIKKMVNLLRPCFDEYQDKHPDEKFGPYTLAELRSKISQLLESTVGATVRIITVADKLKQCTSFALSQSNVFSVVDVVKNVVEMHRFLLDKWADLELIYDPETKYTINGHKLQFEQAVSILLTNACDAISETIKKAGGEGKGKLIIKVSIQDNKIHIAFKDNGCGISEEHIKKIFAPYFTTKPQGVGDGMGLALCQAVIERHDGKIEVQSELGQGTEVTLILPYHKGE